jgi:hypothetical protein
MAAATMAVRVSGVLAVMIGGALAGAGVLTVLALTGRPLPTASLGDWVVPFFTAVVEGAARPAPGALIAELMQSPQGFWALVLIGIGAAFAGMGAVQVVTGRRSKVALAFVVMIMIAIPVAALTGG